MKAVPYSSMETLSNLHCSFTPQIFTKDLLYVKQFIKPWHLSLKYLSFYCNFNKTPDECFKDIDKLITKLMRCYAQYTYM